ncbi:MAG: 5-formyltetrahydrofolate cyclo-ligase [Alphaproteobacteria bacterium]|nr:5-formyltetrahydrofolate cyclo-ligase [Alphaproteobacteria bacterium]
MTLPDPHAAKRLADKQELRARLKARREGLAQDRAAAAEQAARHALAVPDLAGPIAAYWPMGSELDPRPLMAQLAARGFEICLPKVVAKGRPLRFHLWRPGDALEAGPLGTSQPGDRAPECRPRTLIVPLLAFDGRGGRLGYGGGFYDRTLEALRAEGPVLAIGFGFAAQEVEAVPMSPADRRLDWLATESGARKVKS